MLRNFIVAVQELEKFNEPDEALPYPPTCAHQIPDIEEPLRHLEPGLAARVISDLLDDTLLLQPIQLRRDHVRVESDPRSELTRADGIPVERERIDDLLRLGRQGLEARLVERRALVEEPLQIGSHVAVRPTGDHVI